MPPVHDPHRRELLTGLLAGAAVVVLPGCSTCPEEEHEVIEPVFTGDTAPPEATGDTAAPTEPTDTGPVPWLTGGTAALAADYVIDWDDDGECPQACETARGPCYQSSPQRQDVSEGRMGLPTRMAFRVVDLACQPVVGAMVDIWHCDPDGAYSGEAVPAMCLNGDEEAAASAWFRGWGRTDSDGVVEFDTCMPGWYPGRAVHVHYHILLDDDLYVVSQLLFDAALASDVYSTHPDYVARGDADMSNEQDGIVDPSGGDTLFSWRKADDGALVVWKTLVIRQDMGQPAC